MLSFNDIISSQLSSEKEKEIASNLKGLGFEYIEGMAVFSKYYGSKETGHNIIEDVARMIVNRRIRLIHLKTKEGLRSYINIGYNEINYYFSKFKLKNMVLSIEYRNGKIEVFVDVKNLSMYPSRDISYIMRTIEMIMEFL